MLLEERFHSEARSLAVRLGLPDSSVRLLQDALVRAWEEGLARGSATSTWSGGC